MSIGQLARAKSFSQNPSTMNDKEENMKLRVTKATQNDNQKVECLLSHTNFEAKSVDRSRDGKTLDWKAGTLPLSYSRKIVPILAQTTLIVKESLYFILT